MCPALMVFITLSVRSRIEESRTIVECPFHLVYVNNVTPHLLNALIDDIGEVDNSREAGVDALQHEDGVADLDVVLALQARHQRLGNNNNLL